MKSGQAQEQWSSRMGVILAVAGSAVGLGNFLRFPGLAAQYGSGAFMIAYFISLLLLGIPICWVEWTLGRYAGNQGFHSSPGIFYALIRHPFGKYLGVMGVIIPVVIYMYYVYIEAWCLGYSWYFLMGKLSLGNDPATYVDFWSRFIGANKDGLTIGGGENQVLIFLGIVFVLNFYLVYRGLSKGIELFCKYAMPALILMALVILARVLTLGTPDPNVPEQNVLNGLGYMWNPKDVVSQLKRPQLWLAAAGQIFFSLSVGFGVIITYSSYLKKKDDVVLSGLTATSANEFCEVGLGGLITVPAAFVFLGASAATGAGMGLGFKVLPLVFAKMPLPWLFGSMFFFLLFLAAITSSLSMLQPGIAFIEEALGINRKQSVALLATLTTFGSLFVVYFSKDIKALDTMDFWVGTLLLFIMAAILLVYFGWVMGIERGWKEAHLGAQMKIPSIYKFIIKYVAPVYLIIIFAFFLLIEVFGYNFEKGAKLKPSSYVTDLIGSNPSPVARLSIGVVLLVTAFFLALTYLGGKRWTRRENIPNPLKEDKS